MVPMTPATSHNSTASFIFMDQEFDDLPDQDDQPHDLDGSHDDEHGSHAIQKLACDRCRHRKIRCNRTDPCSACVRAKTTCVFPSAPKPREKRQRVLISTQYERKIDHISHQLDELTRSMSQLSHGQAQTLTSQPPAPSFNTPVSTASPFATSQVACDSEDDSVPRLEFEGETSMSAHAVFAAKFIQNVITNNPSIDVSHEMTSAIRNLHSMMNSSKERHGDKIDKVYPNARKLPPGTSTRNLPLPPAEIVLACLRKVNESTLVQMMWFLEFQSVGQFMEYFLKVYSPGAATHWDMIIVHAGLHWLFVGCRLAVEDPGLKKEYLNHALSSRDNLETVLANLPFHTPLTRDCALATSIAACYCIQMCMPSVAWSFAVTASHTCQSLGLHSVIAMSTLSADTRQENLRLFWSVYMTDKLLSVRLGRSSTIRDSDITVPRLLGENSPTWSLNPVLPAWIEASSLHGRVYDDIYSPGALMQPQHVRVARARALAADMIKITSDEDDTVKRYYEARRHVYGGTIHDIFWHLEKIHVSSMLALVYRAIPAEKPSDTIFRDECITAARTALEEHRTSLLEAPFVPFIVLFCHTIETSDGSDLEHLEGLVNALQTTSSMQSYYSTCGKQLHIFKALYDIARKYVEVKAAIREESVQVQASAEGHLSFDPFAMPQNATAGHPPASNERGLHDLTGVGLESDLAASDQFVPDLTARLLQAGQAPWGVGMELDPEGVQLGDWYQRNHEMLRFMENNPF